MRVPIPDIVQAESKALVDLALLGAPVGSKAEAAPDVTAARTGGFLDQPVVVGHTSEELAAGLASPGRGLAVTADVLDHARADHDARTSTRSGAAKVA